MVIYDRALTWEGAKAYMRLPAYDALIGHGYPLGYLLIPWGLFVTLPMFVSMQISICVSMAAVLLRDGVALLVQQLHIGSHARAIAVFSNATSKVKKPLAFITEGIEKDNEVTRLVKFYEAITDYNVCLNDTVGVTFWLLYWIDLFSALGYIAFMLSVDGTNFRSILGSLGGLVIHLTFLLLVTLPVAAAYEKVHFHLLQQFVE